MSWHIEKINPENDEQMHQLVDLYCYRMWGSEDSFGEYKQCPNCRRYFSEEQVANLHLTHCPSCQIELEDAWKPAEVERDLRKQIQRPSAFCFVALPALAGGKVIAFALTYVISPEEIEKHWGQKIKSQLFELANSQPIVYFDELGVERAWRRQGIATALVKTCLIQYRSRTNDPLIFLRTHQNSPALRLYKHIGLEIFTDDTEYGQGRVLLAKHLSKLRI